MPHLLVTCMIALATAATAPATTAPTSQPAWQQTALGEQILRPFEHAPYPHPSRDNGFRRFPRDPHYVDSTVGLFVPRGYRPSETVDYVVYFHGHGAEVARVIPQYQLRELLVAAKTNAILLVPQGPKNASDSGGGKLELDPGAFEKLIAEVTAFLSEHEKIRTSKIGRITLATHSGGYKTVAGILHHGGLAEHVTDVLLLDSSYGSLEWFADWCRGRREGRLVSLYTEHLADENRQLMSLLDRGGVKYRRFDSKKLGESDLAWRGPIFVATHIRHNAVPNYYLAQLLRSGASR